MRRYGGFAVALVADLSGAAGALLVATREWQTVTVPRPAPQPAAVLGLSGRTVDAAPTALALVALAGVVAVLATRGVVRRVVGGVLALAGVGLVWRALAASSAVSSARARSLVTERLATVDAGSVQPAVATHAVWAVLSVACGAVVAAAGAAIAWRGQRWQVMSARYEPPRADPDPSHQQARAASALWTAFDRGEDPTSGAP